MGDADPLTTVYDRLWEVVTTYPEVVDRVNIRPHEDEAKNIVKRTMEGANKPDVTFLPMRGMLRQQDSMTSAATEKFMLRATTEHISSRDMFGLKWALAQAIWRNRSLGLEYVVRIDVDSMLGALAAGSSVPDAVHWGIVIIITVHMSFDRETLPMT